MVSDNIDIINHYFDRLSTSSSSGRCATTTTTRCRNAADTSDDDKEDYSSADEERKAPMRGGIGGRIGFRSIIFRAKQYTKNVTSAQVNDLSPTCRGLFSLLTAYALANKVDDVTVHLIVDQLQEMDSSWCGVFCLYFF